nr:BFH_HP1_G0048750.mRNA.1.CDS.1 [Saccharomyces cerevisiae]
MKSIPLSWSSGLIGQIGDANLSNNEKNEKKKKKKKTSQNYCHEKQKKRERTLKKTINIRLTNQSKWRINNEASDDFNNLLNKEIESAKEVKLRKIT